MLRKDSDFCFACPLSFPCLELPCGEAYMARDEGALANSQEGTEDFISIAPEALNATAFGRWKMSLWTRLQPSNL